MFFYQALLELKIKIEKTFGQIRQMFWITNMEFKINNGQYSVRTTYNINCLLWIMIVYYCHSRWTSLDVRRQIVALMSSICNNEDNVFFLDATWKRWKNIFSNLLFDKYKNKITFDVAFSFIEPHLFVKVTLATLKPS